MGISPCKPCVFATLYLHCASVECIVDAIYRGCLFWMQKGSGPEHFYKILFSSIELVQNIAEPLRRLGYISISPQIIR